MKKTTHPGLDDLLPIALDITASLTAHDRSARLVAAVRRALPCDATALLRLEGTELVPVAAHGLAPDAMGRRFALDEHPRLAVICGNELPTLFPADSPLPDPYDGLLDGSPHLAVHSCLGCPLRVEGELVGVLTADALEPGALDGLDQGLLVHLAALAAAALRTSDLIERLERTARHQGSVAKDLAEDLHDRRGGRLIGQSAVMVRLRKELELVAASDFPVLVTGETGVGKELVVRALHRASARASQPLVYVNCAALPESIVESELFGHERGSFSGAETSRLGKFRVADGASLFLDEIGELPLHVQPKLLHALEGGEIQPVGADHPTRVDVRIYAATNRDLEAEVERGRFRSDLFHRLNVCYVEVPPLREREQDIPQLTGHFADALRRRLGTGPIRIAPDAQAALLAGAWPGNVRELENVVSRAVLQASERVPRGQLVLVQARDVSLGAQRDTPPAATSVLLARGSERRALRARLDDFQRRLIVEALAETGGNWAAAGRTLGLQRGNLHHLAKRLGLR